MLFSVTFRNLFYCFIILAVCILSMSKKASAIEIMADRNYVQDWVNLQPWIYEGMQESDDPVAQREGDAWNKEDSSGLTALDYALLGASAYELGTVCSMVDLGARPGTGNADADLGPALNLARLAVLKAPLEEWQKAINIGGADQTLPNNFTPLLWAAVFQPDAAILQALIKCGADPKIKLPDEVGGQNLLHIVAEDSTDPQAIHILINAGLGVNALTNPQMMGVTPFMLAVRRNTNPEVIKVLLERGANLQIIDSQGQRAWEGLRPEREAWLKEAGFGWLWDDTARQKTKK